jgi:hypothetical protein
MRLIFANVLYLFCKVYVGAILTDSTVKNGKAESRKWRQI